MKTLSAIEVKNKLERNPNVHLINTLSAGNFRKEHIPNSLNINSVDITRLLFEKDEEIILYCADVNCMTSYYAYLHLEKSGYKNIWRFAGGLREWYEKGFPLAS